MAQPGILSWATSIRAAMVNDPCRQSLEDQIQMHGFLFLDDYLDNIFAQARQDPIIDLVKTPGRKKVAPKRTRPAAMAKSAVTLSVEEDRAGKENQEPVNSFHQALLQARTKDINRPPRHQSNGVLAGHIPGKSAKLKVQSVIAEDDESAERSVQVLHAKPVISATTANTTRNARITREPGIVNVPMTTQHIGMEVDDDVAETANTTASSSGQTFHSIPLDSPEIQQPQQSTGPSGANSKYLTEPRTQMPQSHSGPIFTTDNEAMTAPLPDIASSASAPNIMSVPIKDPPTQFPSLPAPSPLRKSMRVQRESSIGLGPTPPLPTTANAVVGAGKRTSWLMKAREVKAMEAPGKHVSAFGPSAGAGTTLVPGASGGLKRKSGEMLATAIPGTAGMVTLEDDEPKRKVAKTRESDGVLSKEKSKGVDKNKEKELPAARQFLAPTHPEPAQIAFPNKGPEQDAVSTLIEVPKEGMIDRLKRTVEGLGARAGKSMTMSLGGPAAAAALAEAKAAKVAAEARIAERDGRSTFPSPTQATIAIEQTTSVVTPKDDNNIGPSPKVRERKLSVSDLVTAYGADGKGKSKENTKEVGTSFKPVRAFASNNSHVRDESTSTTPSNSPPSTRTSNSSFVLPSGPVFNKPPVFVPPPPAVPPKDFSFNPPSTAFALPAATLLDIPTRPPSPSSQKNAPALSAHSTAVSLFSDVVFESQNDGPAWMPNTQDTEYSIARSDTQPSQKIDDVDEDDSWPMVDQKLAAANPSWTHFGFTKEDSMTWSTLPTESQRDTRSTQNRTSQSGSGKDSSAKYAEGAFGIEIDEELGGDDIDLRERQLENLGLEPAGSAKPHGLERSQSQMSMASTSSSQSQIGWVGQATKLVSSVLGGSKNKKPQVPSLQRAAAAAKKEQEERDKKATRMKEMENRRQIAIQRKAEEEKSKAMEEEKKIKEDGERRKREREETTDKRPLKAGIKKVDEDTTKKRKITVDIEKKPVESKKPPSKEKDVGATSRMPPPLSASMTTKPTVLNKSGGGFKPSGSNPVLSSSATYNAQIAGGSNTTVKPTDTKTVKASTASTISSVKGKGKAKIHVDGFSQPTHQLQTQMAARAKAQIQAVKQQQAEAENIELPDINSEYSDSDDEERPRTFDPPDWAQSPELRQQLHMQSTVNPDDIFGPIRPLKMEEVFRTRQSRFRARTSSANWTGSDRLTVEEEKEYVRKMGFR